MPVIVTMAIKITTNTTRTIDNRTRLATRTRTTIMGSVTIPAHS
jgi:hypothetical protein